MRKSQFHVPGMDCPSEEQQIRGAFADPVPAGFDFDLSARTVTIWHRSELEPVVATMQGLGMGAELVDSAEVDEAAVPAPERDQTRVLRLLLAINATMFVVELVAGWLGESAGLLSDSLDMLADATVYGISLWAVGRTMAAKRRAARISGWFELALALFMLAEVARRAIWGSDPQPPVMLGTAALALIANVTCLAALARHRHGEVHMRASWIFSANDVIANLGVIVAGGLVLWTTSPIPDLVIGTVIGLVVLRGALRILRMSTPDGGG